MCAINSRDLITVVGNLIDNGLDAVTDRPPHADPGRVVVHVDWDAEQFRVRVEDDGPGIQPGDRVHVLQRGWSTKAGPPGSRGIGLALVKQAAERAGGVVELGGSGLGGACVEVRLGVGS